MEQERTPGSEEVQDLTVPIFEGTTQPRSSKRENSQYNNSTNRLVNIPGLALPFMFYAAGVLIKMANTCP